MDTHLRLGSWAADIGGGAGALWGVIGRGYMTSEEVDRRTLAAAH